MANDQYLKPIPTLYRGVHYRSRLEARWGVFFTEMKIAFQYEPKSFRMDNDTYYLPDFFLTRVKRFCEVKPIPLSQYEISLCNQVTEQSRRDVLALVGPPDFKEYGVAGDPDDNVSLDTGQWKDYYYDENRFFTCPCYQPVKDAALDREGLEQFSPEYCRAVSYSNFCRFENNGA